VIAIMYNNKVFEMSVLETKPADAVSVIECDLNVDFAPPVGYKEPEFNKKPEEAVT
jgi:ubiquitin fusion degradation protein 1